MMKVIVFILNKGDLPYFLKEYWLSLSRLNLFTCFRYHLPQPRANDTGKTAYFTGGLKQMVPGDVDEFLPEIPDHPEYQNPAYVINLSDSLPADLPWQDSILIDTAYFRNLRGNFSPELCRAFIQKNKTITQHVIALSKSSGRREINAGKFPLLPYNYPASSGLIITACIRLSTDGIRRMEHGYIGNSVPESPDASIPSVLNTSVLKRTILKERIRHRIRQLFYSYKWNIGLITSPISEVALNAGKKWDVQWMEEAGGAGFKADPFGYMHQQKVRIIYEHFCQGKGIIEVSSANGGSRKVLELDHHLSYPFLFSHADEMYCLPEQHESGKLTLYKFHPEEETLEAYAVLLNGFRAVDPSIIRYGEKWWLFCTDADQKGADVRLNIFYADQLTGPWQEHALNPVKTDICSARPGGHLFIKEGRLFRPSQNSSNSYGGELNINQIEILSEDQFRETLICTVTPDQLKGKYPLGCHTISACGNFTLIDGKRKSFRPRNLLKILRKN